MAHEAEDRVARSRDMLGVSTTAAPERVIVLDPKETRWKRDPEHKLVARTMCEIVFDDEQDVQRCIAALRESDERLKERPDEWIMWEWDATYREGMKIVFGVNWYDMAFFNARREAYKNPAHREYFRQFGATADRLKIRHEVMTSVE